LSTLPVSVGDDEPAGVPDGGAADGPGVADFGRGTLLGRPGGTGTAVLGVGFPGGWAAGLGFLLLPSGLNSAFAACAEKSSTATGQNRA